LAVDNISAALLGVSLSYALQVTGSMNFAVRQAVEVEVNANSIERLNYYANDLDQERERILPDHRPPKVWPSEGKIVIDDLSIKYNAEGSTVLKNVTFNINKYEKIGVVGRTGNLIFKRIPGLYFIFRNRPLEEI
jgi:ABC-type multidrug transport system fused ATPase/permease subunit